MRKRTLVLVTAVLAVSSLQFIRAGDQLPKLLDLGADKCIPCKKMAPILEEMKKNFAGVLDVQFVDVWKNPLEGIKYGIQQIPTQIFFDAEGKELFRHVGFFGRGEMLAKWKELGYDFKPAAVAAKPIERWEPAQTDVRAEDAVCDRAVYPEDAALVKAGGVHTWGCCAHCSLGVAARTGMDIEVHQPDALTGEPIVIKTLNGSVASIEPKTAVAWFGMRRKADKTWGSAGCFHQGNFVSVANLEKWLEAHPLETGKQITIQQALADKMKLTPAQISKACKVGECAPK